MPRDDAIRPKNCLKKLKGSTLCLLQVALGSLIQAKDSERIHPDDCIVLNVSGGGVNRLKKDKNTRIVEPWLVAPKNGLADSVVRN